MNINSVLMCVGVVGSCSIITGGCASFINDYLLSPRILEARRIFVVYFDIATNHFSEVYPANSPELLDWNDGALRKALEAYKLELNKPFDLQQIGHCAALSAACTISGHLLGVGIEGIYRKIYQIPDSVETNIAQIGGIFAGIFTLYMTKSIGLSLFNAAVCVIFNPHNKKF